MDDVQNISATLYGKAEPATAKTTMSVREISQKWSFIASDTPVLHTNSS